MVGLNQEECETWLNLLDQAAIQGRATALPAELLEKCTLAQAEALQARLTDRTLARIGGSIIGTKLGSTSAAMLRNLGLASPFRGPLFSARSYASGVRLPRADFLTCIIEAEVGVRLGRDLKGRNGRAPERDDILEAIDMVFPAIEIADTRLDSFAKASAVALISDLGAAGAWIQGAPCKHWRELDLASLAMTLTRDGVSLREGTGAAVLGSPLNTLEMLARDLACEGRYLKAGEYVTTGSFAVPYPSPEGGVFVADFGDFGSVSVELR